MKDVHLTQDFLLHQRPNGYPGRGHGIFGDDKLYCHCCQVKSVDGTGQALYRS